MPENAPPYLNTAELAIKVMSLEHIVAVLLLRLQCANILSGEDLAALPHAAAHLLFRPPFKAAGAPSVQGHVHAAVEEFCREFLQPDPNPTCPP